MLESIWNSYGQKRQAAYSKFIKMYILNSSEQKEAIHNLVLTETLDGGWSRKYRNPGTNENWLEFYVSHGHGGVTILRNDPPPANIAEWLEESFRSNRQDDIVGLALELSEKYETWSEVIDYLEANKNRFLSEQINTFIERLTILHPVNRRPTMNKHITEVERDYQFFCTLSERAKHLQNPA